MKYPSGLEKSFRPTDHKTWLHPNRQGMTHKNEWDAFVRQLKTGAQIPAGVSEYAVSAAGRKDLFNMWLDANQDWKACQLLLERKQEQVNTASRGWEAKQGKTLKEMYSKEKYESLVASRKQAGLWYEDEDFPGDDEDPCHHKNFPETFPNTLLKGKIET